MLQELQKAVSPLNSEIQFTARLYSTKLLVEMVSFHSNGSKKCFQNHKEMRPIAVFKKPYEGLDCFQDNFQEGNFQPDENSWNGRS